MGSLLGLGQEQFDKDFAGGAGIEQDVAKLNQVQADMRVTIQLNEEEIANKIIDALATAAIRIKEIGIKREASKLQDPVIDNFWRQYQGAK